MLCLLFCGSSQISSFLVYVLYPLLKRCRLGWNLVKDQATERYGVVPKEMTDGVAKVNKEYEMLVLDYEESMVITL